jgi:hypothetical protein
MRTTAAVVAGSANTDGTPSRKWWSLGNIALEAEFHFVKNSKEAHLMYTLSYMKRDFVEIIQFLES